MKNKSLQLGLIVSLAFSGFSVLAEETIEVPEGEFPAEIQKSLAYIYIANIMIHDCDNVFADEAAYEASFEKILEEAAKASIPAAKLMTHIVNPTAYMSIESATVEEYTRNATAESNLAAQDVCSLAVVEDKENGLVGQLIIITEEGA